MYAGRCRCSHGLRCLRMAPRVAMAAAPPQLEILTQVLELVGDHRNIAALRGAFEDRDYVYFVLELCKGGELFDRIVSEVGGSICTSDLPALQATHSAATHHNKTAAAAGDILREEGCTVLQGHGGGHSPLPSAGGDPPVRRIPEGLEPLRVCTVVQFSAQPIFQWYPGTSSRRISC